MPVITGHPPPILVRDGLAAFAEPYAAPPLGLLDTLVARLDDHVGDRGCDDILLLLVTMRLPGRAAASLSSVIAGLAAAADAGMKRFRGGRQLDAEETEHAGYITA